jgi:hypothetical protein
VARLTTAREPSSRALCRLAVGLALAKADERSRDLAGREAVAARCLRTLVGVDRALALRTIAVTGDQSRQRLSERMRRAVAREAAKPLALATRCAVAPEELHP